ncbi:WXG100 family type VII secretion target [Mycolicibacterium houstonense]|uniref:WXG100 family type VII secretion target n=1 Tax=Mycolicibacterium houstonense TaxID=146021 RepID=UPI000835849F|nr:WXG100 family type VII secretion target [Mycolicibacterium houstonense]MCV7067865.1 WXG100 family type VII secretion target [Mycolicibacterium farcinogenes]
MALHLTPDEAQKKIENIDQQMMDVRRLAAQILESTEAMTSSSWTGGRAAKFRGIMTQHNEDFNYVINNLQQIVDKGKSDINALVTHDAD